MSNRSPALPRCRFPGCGAEFPVDFDLMQHIALAHGHLPLVCMTCGLQVGTERSLDRHMATHTNARQFPCLFPDCGRACSRKDILGNHLITVHEQQLRDAIHLQYTVAQAQAQQVAMNQFQAQQDAMNQFQAQQNAPQEQQNPPQQQWNEEQQNPPQQQWNGN